MLALYSEYAGFSISPSGKVPWSNFNVQHVKINFTDQTYRHQRPSEAADVEVSRKMRFLPSFASLATLQLCSAALISC